MERGINCSIWQLNCVSTRLSNITDGLRIFLIPVFVRLYLKILMPQIWISDIFLAKKITRSYWSGNFLHQIFFTSNFFTPIFFQQIEISKFGVKKANVFV